MEQIREERMSADLLIIGGGIAGLCAAVPFPTSRFRRRHLDFRTGFI